MALKKSKSKSVTKGKKVIKRRLKTIGGATPDVDDAKKAIVDAVMADVAESDYDDLDEEVEFDEVENTAKPTAKVGKSTEDIAEVEVDQGRVYNISDMVSKKLEEVGGEKVYYNVQLRLPGYCEQLYKGIPPALRKSLREIFIESLREMYDQTRNLR